jgi:hypothetical protein
VGVIDAVTMKGVAEVDELRRRTEESLQRYADLARRLGLRADWRSSIGTEAVAEAERLCRAVAQELPNTIFFAGKLVSSAGASSSACSTTRPPTSSSAGSSSQG